MFGKYDTFVILFYFYFLSFWYKKGVFSLKLYGFV